MNTTQYKFKPTAKENPDLTEAIDTYLFNGAELNTKIIPGYLRLGWVIGGIKTIQECEGLAYIGPFEYAVSMKGSRGKIKFYQKNTHVLSIYFSVII